MQKQSKNLREYRSVVVREKNNASKGFISPVRNVLKMGKKLSFFFFSLFLTFAFAFAFCLFSEMTQVNFALELMSLLCMLVIHFTPLLFRT